MRQSNNNISRAEVKYTLDFSRKGALNYFPKYHARPAKMYMLVCATKTINR